MYCKKFLIFIMIAAALLSNALPAYADNDTSRTAEYLMSAVSEPSCSSIGGEWAVIGIKQSGISVPSSYYQGYLSRLYAYIDERGGDLGRKYTEYSRIALALNTLGENPYSVGSEGYNLFDFINDCDNVLTQGINGPIFALQAKYYCGDTDFESRDVYIGYILENQNGDGSFGLTKGVPDVDITAMAISALCLYGGNLEIDRAVNRAFLYLSSVQLPSGGFSELSSDGEASCESTAQVIIAMKRYGLAPDNKFFVKNGRTALDAMNDFRQSNGGYSHTLSEGAVNQMATEQALTALSEPQSTVRSLIYDTIWFEANVEYFASEKSV